MWLLNTSTLKLRSFFENIPNYVILSHTWGEGEVAFEDIDQPHARSLPGFNKILGCCRLAIRDGFEWAWIDTCCIDKRSSAELSEAINSMYNWYWQSSICYAYLSDVMPGGEWEQELESSRWFTRGWTLQELLAPDVVEFYNEAWSMLGTKSKLLEVIARITRIERRFLLSRTTIQEATIATKLSWAALRKTTRVEDMTYCLLGLVQVNMPMLYGEGARAFFRLQLEIIKQNNEHSIFAWEPVQRDWQMTAILAPSPRCFEHLARIRPTVSKKPVAATTHEVTNNGLRITLPILSVGHDRCIALLDCEDEVGSIIGIWLEKLGRGRYQRLAGSKLAHISRDEEEDTELQVVYLIVDNNRNDVANDTACQLVVKSVLTDVDCLVTGIDLITRSTIVAVKPRDMTAFDQDYDEKGKERLRYLLRELVIVEGEAALVCLSTSGSNSAWILLALRNGRPFVSGVSPKAYADFDWPYHMRANDSSVWDLLGDCIDTYNESGAKTQVESKKQQQKNGTVQWSLTIRRFTCVCGTTSGHMRCHCLTYGRVKLKAAKLYSHEPRNAVCTKCEKELPSERPSLCACTDCQRDRGEARPAQKIICKNCRWTIEKRKRDRKALIANNNITHYMECPCSVCERQSKIGLAWYDGTEKSRAQDLVCDDCIPERDRSIQVFHHRSGIHYAECQCSLCAQESRIELRVWHDGAEPWWLRKQPAWPQFTDTQVVRRVRSFDIRIREPAICGEAIVPSI
jgi:hypothetical protein